VPQLVHMNATRPGPPPNGAISATLAIGCRHRLQALCATTFIVLPLEVGPSLTARFRFNFLVQVGTLFTLFTALVNRWSAHPKCLVILLIVPMYELIYSHDLHVT
jgi:hypothetical protein